MRFCQYYSCFMSATEAARLAGYSEHSARWQAHRLWRQIGVIIFYSWYMDLTTSGMKYIPFLDNPILIKELSKYFTGVHGKDITEAMTNPPIVSISAMVPNARNLITNHMSNRGGFGEITKMRAF